MIATGKPEYAVVGGGIAGLSLAIALHHRGVSVTLYEQAGQLGEIGAGVSFTPNAVQAMRLCHKGIHQAFEEVCTRNVWESKQDVWFDYYDAIRDEHAFTIRNSMGQRGVHRAKFLEKMTNLFPMEQARFGKRLDSYSHDDDGRITLKFVDGEQVRVDALLACDGIKSRVRQVMFDNAPCAWPGYTGKYAYRALVKMEDAIAAVGEQKAQNACMHMGKRSHVLTFPVNHGQTMNVVAFHTSNEPWNDTSKFTAPATREDALRDFDGFGHTVTKLLSLAQPQLDIWAIFDLADHPPPSFVQGQVCLVGDAAHATSPHHGAGAGFCIEDVAILASLLSHESVTGSDGIQKALALYNDVRQERGAWLVQSSRFIGNVYEWIGEGVGDDIKLVEKEINTRNGQIANVDVQEMCNEAIRKLASST